MDSRKQQFVDWIESTINLSDPETLDDQIENLATILAAGNTLWNNLVEDAKDGILMPKTKELLKKQAQLKGLKF